MVQGFYFALLQYSHIQAFTARFVPSMQLYHQHSKAAHRALHGLFQLFAVFCRRCVSGASGYTALPVPRWSVSQRRSISSAYQIPATRWTLYRPAQPPYYNKVYKGAAVCLCYRSMPDGATHRRPCQPGGVSMLPTPGISMAPGWPGISLALCFLPGTAARNHWRLPPYLFSGFRPIANRGQQ